VSPPSLNEQEEMNEQPEEVVASDHAGDGLCRILSLDGGGAKGFYTLGVLREIEGMLKCRLHERFDLVFGTSTGAIIAALIALGYSVEEIHQLYKTHVPNVMKAKSARDKSDQLATLAQQVFGNARFEDVKTGIGIVTTKWLIERPMIFKAHIGQVHGRTGTGRSTADWRTQCLFSR
jgi:uncharacterized protein